MIARIRSLLPALLLSACSAPLIGADGGGSVARLAWERQGIDDYRYRFAVVCYCIGRGEPVQVTVRNGQVADVQSTTGGSLIPVLTVDELFDAIEDAEARGTYTRVEYHPRLGYPTSAEIGTLSNDGGTLYVISDLARLD